LESPAIIDQYASSVTDRLRAITEDNTGSRDFFKEAHRAAAEEVLGFWQYSRYDWISAASRQLIENKRRTRLNKDHAEHKRLTKECRKSVRKDKQKLADRKAVLEEQLLQQGAMNAFAHFWELRAACPQISSSIIDENDKLISDKKGKAAW